LSLKQKLSDDKRRRNKIKGLERFKKSKTIVDLWSTSGWKNVVDEEFWEIRILDFYLH
jgi:hypothetical protein